MSMMTLRNRNVGTARFRAAAGSVSAVLMKRVRAQVGTQKRKDVVLVIILRAALALLPEAIRAFPNAPVGVLGMKRNETTLRPYSYYENLPHLKGKTIVLLDPMLATGCSAEASVEKFLERGVKAKNIIFAGIIAASEGLSRLALLIPKENIIVAELDKKLNRRGMIVPGLGDFGDRYFGYKGNPIFAPSAD